MDEDEDDFEDLEEDDDEDAFDDEVRDTDDLPLLNGLLTDWT